jgi:hypothetical protein
MFPLVKVNACVNAGDSDSYCTCLGHLGCSDINRNNPICVTSQGKYNKCRCCLRYHGHYCVMFANVNDPLNIAE